MQADCTIMVAAMFFRPRKSAYGIIGFYRDLVL